MSRPCVLITGATGFVGQQLSSLLRRSKYGGYALIHKHKQTGDLNQTLRPIRSLSEITKPIDIVINLAGANIADRRWSASRKKQLIESRINTTNMLVSYFKSCAPPKVWVNASAIGYYGDHKLSDEIIDENSPYKDDFCHQLCAEWEKTAQQVQSLGARQVILRFGVILGPNGGALKKMALSYKFRVASQIGTGEQWFSWVHIEDVLAVILEAIENDTYHGTYNLTAPHPVMQRHFTDTMSSLLDSKFQVTLPESIARVLFGEMATLLVGGQRVVPNRLQQAGYIFRYEDIKPALQNCLGQLKVF